MVFVQDGGRFLEVVVVFGTLIPRDIEQPFEVAADDASFPAGRGQHLIAAEFLVRLLDDGFRIGIIGEQLAQIVKITGSAVIVQLFLDRLQLLTEIVVLLALFDVGLDLGVDLFLDALDFLLLVHDLEHHFQTLDDVRLRQELLLVRQLHDVDLGIGIGQFGSGQTGFEMIDHPHRDTAADKGLGQIVHLAQDTVE